MRLRQRLGRATIEEKIDAVRRLVQRVVYYPDGTIRVYGAIEGSDEAEPLEVGQTRRSQTEQIYRRKDDGALTQSFSVPFTATLHLAGVSPRKVQAVS